MKWETSDPENPQGREVLSIARELVTIANAGKTPTVLDPFAGGGAIPLEATRLGCQAIANDYNPVAYLILRATCEFPQKYGKRLVRDVEHWAKWILERVRQRIGHLYPAGKDGQPVVGYLWAHALRLVPTRRAAPKSAVSQSAHLQQRRQASGPDGWKRKAKKSSSASPRAKTSSKPMAR